MRARSVPPTPSLKPAPPVLARTSSMLVLSRRSSQRMALSGVCPLPVERYTGISRARKSQVARTGSARPTAVARDVSRPQGVVECLGKGVGVDEGLGRRIAIAPAAEDALLLHLRERLARFQRAGDRCTRVLQHLQVLAQLCDAGNLAVPGDDPGIRRHTPEH